MHIRRQIQSGVRIRAKETRAGRGAGPGRQPLKTGPTEEVGLALGVEVGLLVGLALGVGVGVRDGVSVGEADGEEVGEAVGVSEGLAVDTHRPISRHVPFSAGVRTLPLASPAPALGPPSPNRSAPSSVGIKW